VALMLRQEPGITMNNGQLLWFDPEANPAEHRIQPAENAPPVQNIAPGSWS